MIDLRRLRNSPDEVRTNLARRHIDLTDLESVISIDSRVRELSARRDEIRAQVKTISKSVGEARKKGETDKAEALAAESKTLGDEERGLDVEVSDTETRLRDLLLGIPNEISPDVPDGLSEDDNPIVIPATEREWADYQRVPHWDIGKELGILDSDRAVRMSGSMFNMFRGAGATLARALCQLGLDRNADAWEEIRPPTIVRSETMVGCGYLPKDEMNMYAIERDDLWTIPTAEAPLTSMESGEILDEASLPQRMMAYTPCYRREAGAAGKDTRGLLRVHEFDKVELMAYTTPEQGESVMLEIRERALGLANALGLQTRVIEICSGDLGQAHHRSFDIEAYAPGTDKWLEVSSCSWFNDYQSRRANVRYRPLEGKSTQLVHTVNGSGVAVPRVWAALVETHHQQDGSVRVPEVLRPYMRGIEVISPR